jgi:Transposase DDE domain
MKLNTLSLPGFARYLHARQNKCTAETMIKKAQKLDGLAALVGRFIPMEQFTIEGERKRMFTPMITFTAFLGQVMSRGSSCRDAVRRVQAWAIASRRQPPDDNTSGYCQARGRLSMELLQKAHERVCEWFGRRTKGEELWLGRSVKVVDGTGISMPDTDENRKAFPYAGGQRKGCGFPTGKLVGLFCLATGHLSKFTFDSWKNHDITLLRRLLDWIQDGDILLGDRGFCGWGVIAALKQRNVDVVFRLHQARKDKEGTSVWKKPKCKEGWEQESWDELPDAIEVRVITYRVEIPGFRTNEITLATTLLDAERYPDKEVIKLYNRRWQVELNFRDIKTTLGLDVLRTEIPGMIEKEIYMQVIAYNMIRGVMLESARQHNKSVYRISFKGTVDTLRQWIVLFGHTDEKTIKSRYEDILLALACDLVPERPNRSEPRAVKRRPKVYQRLTKPRDEMVVSSSRRNK